MKIKDFLHKLDLNIAKRILNAITPKVETHTAPEITKLVNDFDIIIPPTDTSANINYVKLSSANATEVVRVTFNYETTVYKPKVIDKCIGTPINRLFKTRNGKWFIQSYPATDTPTYTLCTTSEAYKFIFNTTKGIGYDWNIKDTIQDSDGNIAHQKLTTKFIQVFNQEIYNSFYEEY